MELNAAMQGKTCLGLSSPQSCLVPHAGGCKQTEPDPSDKRHSLFEVLSCKHNMEELILQGHTLASLERLELIPHPYIYPSKRSREKASPDGTLKQDLQGCIKMGGGGLEGGVLKTSGRPFTHLLPTNCCVTNLSGSSAARSFFFFSPAFQNLQLYGHRKSQLHNVRIVLFPF